MFGLVIECEKRGVSRYFIMNEDELHRETVANWMLSSLSISTLLYEKKRIYERILIEQIPSANEHLDMVLQAMYGNVKLRMTYSKYESSEKKEYTALPYCLKLFRRRWYVAMAIEKEDGEITPVRIFSIDRIKQLQLLEEKFTMPEDFDAESIFRDCFGVVIGDGTECETIRLRAFGRERFALKDLPIHQSQHVVAETEEYVDFELQLKPTADFKAFLASKGQWLVVISPQSLEDDIVAIHQEAISKYSKM
jgi:predicted DNA-binding transcriptional regulator YafY